MVLDLGEARFRGVQVWLVRDIVYCRKAELVHLLLDVISLVNSHVVHQDCYLLMLVGDIELIQVFFESLLVHTLRVQLAVLEPSFLRDGQDESVYLLVDLGQRKLVLLLQVGVVTHQEGLGGQDALIEVDDPVSLVLQHLDPLLHVLPPRLVLLFLLRLDELCELDPLPLDLVQPVHLPQQRWVDPVVSEVPVKQSASSCQRLAAPTLKGFLAGEEFNMFFIQKSIAIPLS